MRRIVVFQLLFFGASFVALGPSSVLAARAVGIDISNYQGSLTNSNWNSIDNAGKSFAWAKASEGTGFIDSTFTGNMNKGRNAGVYVGAYHFARPDLHSNATLEAQHFLDVAQPNGPNGANNYLGTGYMRPTLDIETRGVNSTAGRTYLSNWINTFCDYVVAHGGGASVEPIIYMNSNYAANYVNSTVASRDLWIANYVSGTNPSAPTGNPPGAGTGVWSDWAFWQYSSSGSVPGISGNVDLDVAHGDLNFVKQFVIGGVTPTTEYFDVNGAASGSGVASNGSYTWEGAGYSSSSAGTDPVSWVDGNFLRLAAGTDAGAKNYTITANSNHTFAGMFLQSGGGGTVTINGSGILSIADGDQGMYVSTNSQNLKVNASLAGTGRLVWQGDGGGAGGSFYLLGNNSYSGGTLLNTAAGLNFNNNNSFGSGRITWGVDQQVLADDVATSPITLGNKVTTRAASQLIYVGPAAAPVTFTGAWTLASGTSTLTVGNSSHASSKMTISGNIGGSGGALVKDGEGTLVLNGANSYNGGTTLQAGSLTVSGASARLGTGNVTVQNSSGVTTVLSIQSGVLDAISDSASLNLAGGGTAGVADQSYAYLGDGVNEIVHALILAGAE